MKILHDYTTFSQFSLSMQSDSKEPCNWKDLQELRVVGEGSSSTTLAVKKLSFSKEEKDRFNIDHLISQNDSLKNHNISSTLSMSYQEHAMAEKLQGKSKGEGSLAELRKALGELVLLQTLTTALRESTSYALKDTYGQEYDKKVLTLPLTQEIDVMQRINTRAHTTMTKQLQNFRQRIAKQRSFENDLQLVKKFWPVTIVDRRTRQTAEKPEVITYNAERDILAIDCYWRSRPRMFQNPYYQIFLRQSSDMGNIELDPAFNPHIFNTEKSIFYTLQMSVQNIHSNVPNTSTSLASLDLWALLFANHQPQSLSELSSYPEHLQHLFRQCIALQHTSLARDIFQTIVEEVHKVTNIVTAVTESTEFSFGTSSFLPLTEQFTLCEHSEKQLTWQIAAHLLLTIQLVPLSLDRISPHSIHACEPDESALWNKVVSTAFAAMLGTFHARLAVVLQEEINRQWRHRSGEAEKQFVSLRINNAATAKTKPIKAKYTFEPDTVLTETFRCLRIRYQQERLLQVLQTNLPQVLHSSQLIAFPNSNGVNEQVTISLVNKEFEIGESSSEMTFWRKWWQQNILPLLSFTLDISVLVFIPPFLTESNQIHQSNLIFRLRLCSPFDVTSMDTMTASWKQVHKEIVAVQAINSEFSNSQQVFVALEQSCPTIVQHVLTFSFKWLCEMCWTPILSTDYAFSFQTTVQPTCYAIVAENHPSAVTSKIVGHCFITIWQQIGHESNYATTLTWRMYSEQTSLNLADVLSKLMKGNAYQTTSLLEMSKAFTVAMGHPPSTLSGACQEVTVAWK